jgi:hypothetical protein
MVHAGLAPQWDLTVGAAMCAREFEPPCSAIPEIVRTLYGDQPDRWDDALEGEERLRFIANCFTRLRYVDAGGRLMLRAKGSPKKAQGKVADPLVRGAGARWRGRASSSDTGRRWVFQQRRRHRPRYRAASGEDSLTALRLGRSGAKPVQVCGCADTAVIMLMDDAP